MSHPDTSWRVSAIYRACQRYGMGREWALKKLEQLCTYSQDGKIIDGRSIPNLADIWFRGEVSHMDQSREDFNRGKQPYDENPSYGLF